MLLISIGVFFVLSTNGEVTPTEQANKFTMPSVSLQNSTGTIEYNYDVRDINITLQLDLGLGFASITDSLWQRTTGNNIKFGYNKTFALAPFISDRNISVKYIINSNDQIIIMGNKIISTSRITSSNCEKFVCNNERYEEIDFSDVCDPVYNITGEFPNTTSILVFDPQCSFTQITSNQIGITFKTRYSSLKKNIDIDPTITITDIGSYTSTKLNVTAENNFTHLSIGNISTGFINDTNLVLYMPFDTNNNSNGKTYDYSVNGNDGTYTNGARWNSSGVYGGSAWFDGTDDRIDIPHATSLIIPNNLTVCVWTKTKDNTANFQRVISKDDGGSNLDADGWFIQLSRTGTDYHADLYVGNNGNYVVSTNAVFTFLNTWHHVCGMFSSSFANATNGNTSRLYVDGIREAIIQGGQEPKTSIGANTGILYLGALDFGGLYYGNIVLDEVTILNTTLTDSQVTSLYNNQSSRFFPRGEQIFNNINASSDGTENFINITINSSMNFGSIINVTVGILSGGSYSYGSEYAFTNNFVSGIPITTPNNISLKFIFYSGNSSVNSFYSPTLEKNINITGYTSDVTYPSIYFINQTPINGSSQQATFVPINVSIEESQLNEVKFNWNGTNYSFYNDSLVLMMNFENLSALGENATKIVDVSKYCYDNETEILTENGWKYFYELNGEEEVATLNNKTGEIEYQKPTGYQSFDNNGDMYRIETENGNLLVSPEHKVYGKINDEENEFNLSNNSLVLNTSTLHCFFNNFSSDQIRQSNFNANAKYAASFVCSGNSSYASGMNWQNSCSEISLILSLKTDNTSENSASVLCVLDSNSSLLLANSSRINSGAINSMFLDKNRSLDDLLPFINNENNSLASITTRIYLSLLENLFDNDSLIFLPNLRTSSCVNSLSFEKDSSILSCTIFFSNASLATSDQFITLNSDNSFLNSSEIAIVRFGILPPDTFKHVDTQNTHVYKSFGSSHEVIKDIYTANFSLMGISEVYSSLGNKTLVFLDDNGNEIKVKSISKQNYSGKIYDVDVPNDIVLVKRGNGSAIWSGNSNNGTVTGATWNSSGKYGGAYSFDGVNDDIQLGNSYFLNGSTAVTLSTWVYKYSDINYQGFLMTRGTLNSNTNIIGIQADASGKVGAAFQNGNTGSTVCTYISSGATSINAWHHYVATWDKNNLTANVSLYIDGILDTGGGKYFGNCNATLIQDDYFKLGLDDTAAVRHINGSIDEVRIWNRSLSASEIQELYRSNLQKYNTTQWYLYINQSLNSTQGLNNGTYNYQAFASDTSNNWNNTEVRQVTIDRLPPSITLNYPTSGLTLSNNAINFNWTASDNFDTNLSCNLTINGAINVSGIGSSSGIPTNYSISGIADGSYSWNITCIDDALNVNTSLTYSFTVDTTPTISNLSAYSITNQSAYITFNCDISCNTTLLIYNGSIKNSTYLFNSTYDNSFSLQHTYYYPSLSNFTAYFINLTVGDISGNLNSNNTFNFTTLQTAGIAETTLWLNYTVNEFNYTYPSTLMMRAYANGSSWFNFSDTSGNFYDNICFALKGAKACFNSSGFYS